MFLALSFALLVVLGFAVGAFGTLVGAGGGFILAPVLLLVYRADSPQTITAISLAVVFFNALSGTVAYRRLRRIDYRSGAVFAAATLPGAVAGALLTAVVPRRAFDAVMALLLAGMAIQLLRPRRVLPARPGGGSPRVVVDSQGRTYRYQVPMLRGTAYSSGVGFVSSFLGIGGGVIHVPLLIGTLGFPVHVATATSHFVLMFMAFAGTVTHIAAGSFQHGEGAGRVAALSIGVIAGAQVGARMSSRWSGAAIQRLLAAALLLISLRLLIEVA